MTQLPDTTTEQGQREASVMLARLMGELSECTCGTPGCTVGTRIDSGHGWFVTQVHNLYAPANMARAWAVLNWAMNTKPDMGVSLLLDVYRLDSFECGFVDLPRLQPSDAQRAWLDKVLSLAIEAGMIEVKE